ncbi:zinc metalloproteinase nas-14 [Nothobranchius furzeri]|uniref:Metalloendopeptidase n=1 Tax=Nothobranchius furzeri TaxID=105023 RepID=A0A9D3C5Q6_NOTFU|nr:zinc metalloproteinase nas-14-like [Nothobranchius furzeri]
MMMMIWVALLLGSCSLSTGFPVNSTSGAALASATPQLGVSHNASGETLTELQGDQPTLEGDILLEEDRNAVNTVWSDGVVPYVIDPEIAFRTADILKAFNMIMSLTCIRFMPHTYELNYIEIKNGQGCSSYVGCRGGSQPVYFESTCTSGNLCHELIHALGMYHEHTRPDRDDHIIVQWQSIIPGKSSNFDIKVGNTLNLPYDFESIMHYGRNYFSVDGSPTIETKGSAEIGQRSHLSQLDVQKLNALYHC